MPNTEQSINETGGVPEIELEVEVYGMISYPTDKTLSIPDMPADAKKTGEEIANLMADIANLMSDMYPVGSVYVTTAETLPQTILDIGTWVEIAVPLTLIDIKKGSRHFIEPEESFTPGNLHFWQRTE